MNLVIKTFHEKVGPERLPNGWLKVHKGVYVLKSTTAYRKMGGWKSPTEWLQSMKKREKDKNFMGWEGVAAKFSRGTAYGIHSYQTVELSHNHQGG